MKFLRTVDNYWFGCGSPTSLGFLRIVMGFLVTIDLLVMGLRWEDWFSEKGYVPASLAQMWFPGDPYVWYSGKEAPIWEGGRILPKINLLSGITNPLWAQIFFWGVVVFAILTTLGLWTRLSTILLALGIVSLHHRDPLILMGGDTVLRVIVLYLALAPCGAACSLDRLIGLWKGKLKPGPVVVSLWSQRLITYNVALLYVTTVWLKWYGIHWRTGDASYYSSNLPEFFRFPYPHFLVEMPWVRFGTYAALLVEFLLGTMVFYRPWRKYVLWSGIVLHGGIEYTMNVPLFGYILVSTYICFFDGEEVSAWFKGVGERFKSLRITVHIPEGHTLAPNSIAVLSALDPLGLVEYLPGSKSGFEVTRANGVPVRGVWIVATRSMGAWPILGIPWIWNRFLTRALEA